MSDDLVVRRAENILQGYGMCYIPDRTQPEFCEICGRDGVETFWTGRYTVCVRCHKDAKILRRYGVFLPDGGLTVKSFMQRLASNEKLLRRLFNDKTLYHK